MAEQRGPDALQPCVLANWMQGVETQAAHFGKPERISDGKVMKVVPVPFPLLEPVARTRHWHASGQQLQPTADGADIGKIDEYLAAFLRDSSKFAKRVEGVEQVLDDHHRDRDVE
ncbi:MAG: hypothetical protein WBN85_11040 [Candidatus Macondimonas sp.]